MEMRPILSFILGMILIFLLTKAHIFLYFALCIGFGSLISQHLRSLFNATLHKFQKGVSFILGELLLFVSFLVFVCPFGLIYKIVNGRKFYLNKNMNSYFIETNKKFKFEDLREK